MIGIAIISALILILGVFGAGYAHVKDPSFDIEESLFQIVIVAIAWPILLLITVIVLPFCGLFWLGTKLARRSGK